MIKCSTCQAPYIGETGRNLTTRLNEHKRATKKGDLNNIIAEHHLKASRSSDLDSATCLTCSIDYYQRITLESLSTSSRTLQTFTQQETVTLCLLFVVYFKTHLFA